MNDDHPTTLEKLIDHLQTALLAAQGIDQTTHDLRGESRVLVEAVKRAANDAHAMRVAAQDDGGVA